MSSTLGGNALYQNLFAIGVSVLGRQYAMKLSFKNEGKIRIFIDPRRKENINSKPKEEKHYNFLNEQ